MSQIVVLRRGGNVAALKDRLNQSNAAPSTSADTSDKVVRQCDATPKP